MQQSTYSRTSQRGFTRTELCVVIVITGILFVILAPVFVQARDKGHGGDTCISHQKQLETGIMIYAQRVLLIR
jgi:prepilin-type N-terminal cleavage/methylation domain-containing protein